MKSLNMKLLKKYIKANSMLESVIAIALISACIYISLLVCNQVFSKKLEEDINFEEKKMNNIFYELQVGTDSIYNSNIYSIDEQNDGVNMKIININPMEGAKVKNKKQFYVNE